jgi:Protein of unknown function (DUF2975)
MASPPPRRELWLSILQAVLGLAVVGIVLAAAGLVLMVGLAAADVGRWPVTIPVIGVPTTSAPDLPPGVRLTGPAQLTMELDLGQTLLFAAGALPLLVLGLCILVLLLRTLRDAIRGEVFTAVNARRIRTVGLLLLFGGVAGTAVQHLTNWLIARSVVGDLAGGPFLRPPWAAIGAGVAVLAVTEIVHRGVLLRAELDEVV